MWNNSCSTTYATQEYYKYFTDSFEILYKYLLLSQQKHTHIYIYIYIYTRIYRVQNYITNAPTCFGASAPSSGSLYIVFAKVKHAGTFVI